MLALGCLSDMCTVLPCHGMGRQAHLAAMLMHCSTLGKPCRSLSCPHTKL